MFYACHLPRSASSFSRKGSRPLRSSGPRENTTPFIKRPPLLS
ncbi:hypothetical protein SAMCFNEI73_Ch1512 [Sinorhizobium americanum]|uniref:Uncharacterized protein n=1 Tax=Sinorhizobium americanum TaxID=194963 RepID=A0A1L3LL56_9HYPH|nr:hypothetical protein SAMCFNEI73_Ch1512 [Sinorhizobium americanum]